MAKILDGTDQIFAEVINNLSNNEINCFKFALGYLIILKEVLAIIKTCYDIIDSK